MSGHDWLNQITPLYVTTQLLRKKAAEGGANEVDVEVREVMQDIEYRIDQLAKKLSETLK